MTQELKIRLVELLAEKSRRDSVLYAIADVERETGIERRRLYDLRDGKVRTIKPEEITALCDYFPCEVGELLHYQSPLEQGQEYVTAPKLNFVAAA
ncbi:MAG: helix-turn-helix transcriptional regulator [Anaerolineae bacterium]|nr:helix-turn-helix transcriptional regulator [Anaerolineae bacterium]